MPEITRRQLLAGATVAASMATTKAKASGDLYVRAVDHEAQTIMSHRQVHGWLGIRPRNCTLVVIDPIANHPNIEWFDLMEQHLWEVLMPFMADCKAAGVKVYVMPTSFDIHPWLVEGLHYNSAYSQWWNNTSESDPEWLDRKMRNNNRDILMYAGYAANYCVYNKPAGIEAMRSSPYKYRPLVFVRDASIAYESAESVPTGGSMQELWWGEHWRSACYDVESRAGSYTSTISDVENWL